MPNSFNCTNGTSYLLRNVFNMTLPVYILININSEGFSGGYLFYCSNFLLLRPVVGGKIMEGSITHFLALIHTHFTS